MNADEHGVERTHYVLGDDPAHPRTVVLAICGVLIRRGESAVYPSCLRCQELLREYDTSAVDD